MIPRFKPWLGWPEFAALFRCNRGAVERFEKAFARAFHAVDAVAFPYGRSAQWAFFKAMGIENAEIIMPAYTCSVVAHAVSLSGNTPRFIDIDLHDYNMSLDEAEAAITEHTRAIIATHTFGYPQDLDRLEAMVSLAEKRYGHKIWLMQDCCHAFGAEWKGRMIGTSGDVAVYALNISKMMTSIFGGILTFQDQELANKVRRWRDSNFTKSSFLKALQRRLYLISIYLAFNKLIYRITLFLQESTPLLNKFTKSFHLDDKIHFPPDYNQQMLNVEAAVGIVQLKKYGKIIEYRRRKAYFYNKTLERKEGWMLPPLIKGATYSHYVVRVPSREKVVKYYLNKGIQLGELIQYSIPELCCYRDHFVDCPRSSKASKSTINFPVSIT